MTIDIKFLRQEMNKEPVDDDGERRIYLGKTWDWILNDNDWEELEWRLNEENMYLTASEGDPTDLFVGEFIPLPGGDGIGTGELQQEWFLREGFSTTTCFRDPDERGFPFIHGNGIGNGS